jgi:hypothetical protein
MSSSVPEPQLLSPTFTWEKWSLAFILLAASKYPGQYLHMLTGSRDCDYDEMPTTSQQLYNEKYISLTAFLQANICTEEWERVRADARFTAVHYAFEVPAHTCWSILNDTNTGTGAAKGARRKASAAARRKADRAARREAKRAARREYRDVLERGRHEASAARRGVRREYWRRVDRRVQFAWANL